jgi:hypothetical protein
VAVLPGLVASATEVLVTAVAADPVFVAVSVTGESPAPAGPPVEAPLEPARAPLSADELADTDQSAATPEPKSGGPAPKDGGHRDDARATLEAAPSSQVEAVTDEPGSG